MGTGSPTAGEPIEIREDPLKTGVVRIEGATAPGEVELLLLVLGIGDGLEDLGLAGRAADVLWSTAA